MQTHFMVSKICLEPALVSALSPLVFVCNPLIGWRISYSCFNAKIIQKNRSNVSVRRRIGSNILSGLTQWRMDFTTDGLDFVLCLDTSQVKIAVFGSQSMEKWEKTPKHEKKRNVLSENWTEMRNKPVTPNMGHVGHADRITGLDLPLKKYIVIS